MNLRIQNYNISPKPFNQGGAASVYECERISDGEKCVLKELTNKQDNTKVERFKREIETMQKCTENGIHGIMPIYEFNKDELWYIMPKAKCLKDCLEEYGQKQKLANPINTNRDEILVSFVDDFIMLAETFSKIHEIGYTHRDIKPHNLYYHNEYLYVGDFGIVDIPDEHVKQLTKKGNRLGAWNTIAPEVLRDARTATEKADVYSLAKTFWMCLALNLNGFDGRYDYNVTSMSLHDIPHLSGAYLLDIDELLSDCTQEDPNLRPTMKDFVNKLKTWKEINGNFIKRNKKEWSFLYKSIFNDFRPSSLVFIDRNDIARALNILSRYTNTNYILLPSRGGIELHGARIAPESGCVYLDCGICFICRPKRLTFRGFVNKELWNYFYLELDNLKPILHDEIEEELIEDTPGHYTDPTYAAHGVYDYESGKPLPKGWKKVSRFNSGSFLIVAKSSFYNSITPVTDARHSLVSEEEFFVYMNSIKEDYDKASTDNYSEVRKKYWNNPFKISDIEIENRPKPMDDNFVGQYLHEFNFFELLDNTGNSSAAYAMIIKTNEKHSIFEKLYSKKDYYLCKDGKIRYLKYDDQSIFFSKDRTIAKSIKSKIDSFFEQYCIEKGMMKSSLDANVEIEIRMTNIPEHIFKYKELKEAIIQADDRVPNTVCIDENGYVALVSPEFSQFYPVSYNQFSELNNYVGPYSKGKKADEIIKDLRVLWLDYLETGFGSRYSEDIEDEERKIEDIYKATKTLIKEYRDGTKTAPLLRI